MRWMICYLVTVLTFLLVVNLASQGELTSDLAEYQSDKLIFVIYLLAGVGLTQRCIKFSTKFDAVSISLSFLYYYSAFSIFSDGHVAGWSHSPDSLTDKLFMGFLIGAIYVVSIIVPLAALIIAIIQNRLLKMIWYYVPDY